MSGALDFPGNTTGNGGTGLLGLSQRLPPQDLAAEQYLLGTLLANNASYQQVSDFLRPEHFAAPEHQAVFAALARRIEAGELADAITLRQEFEGQGTLAEVGGAAYLVKLLGAMMSPRMAGEYGRVVHDLYMRRQIIEAGEELVNLSFGADSDVLDHGAVLEKHHARLEELGKQRRQPERIVSIGTAAERAVAAAEEAFRRGGLVGLTTGFAAMDEGLDGLEPGTLTIIGGRPGMGKTALALQMMLRQAMKRRCPETGEVMPGLKAGMLSLEMASEQLGRRAVALASRIHYRSLKRGTFLSDPRQVDRVRTAMSLFTNMPVLIEDQAGLSPQEIRQRARAMRRKLGGLDVLYVDHLHIVGRGMTASRHGDTQAITEASQFFKALSKEMQIPVVLLAQLSRGVEERDDKRPVLSDLRQSGAIEQDADNVMFVYRPEYYLGDAPAEKRMGETNEQYANRCSEWEAHRRQVAGVAEVIIAKNREGEGNVTARLRWDKTLMRFHEPREDAGADVDGREIV